MIFESIFEAIKQNNNGLHVAMPAVIKRYDATTQLCDALPAVKMRKIDADGNAFEQPYPTLLDVPVLFPRAGDFFISMPLAAGDTVLLVFCDHAIDPWLVDGGENLSSQDTRSHDLSDAVAIPCVWPSNRALKSASANQICVGIDNSTQVKVTGGGAPTVAVQHPNKALKSATIAEEMKTLYDSLQTQLNTLKTDYSAHIHTAQGPTSPTTPPTVPTTFSPPSWPAPDNITSARLKISEN